MLKKLILLSLNILFYTITYSQVATWMIGTWKSRNATTTASGSVTNTIQINDVTVETFTGTRTSEINGSHATITISISGAFRARGLYLQDGALLHKEPQNVPWYDCSACSQESKMMISHDSLMLVTSISGCGNGCDGETFYYKLLSEYDDDTQRYLVDRFGRPSDIIGFHPYQRQKGDTVVAHYYNEPVKQDAVATAVTTDPDVKAITKEARRKDSLDNLARIKQQQQTIVQQKQQEKIITDSLNLVKQKEKRRLKDSLDNVARLEKIRLKTEDSLRDVQAKDRKKQIADSLNLAKQKELQRIKDSLDNLAKIRRQQINDSTLLAQQKKREQRINDSLNLVQQKEQQRIKDSLDNVARLEQIKLRTEDSLRNALVKKRQQEMTDSLSLANQKEQQRIKDSLQNVITDSLAALSKQKNADSLQRAALAKTVKQTTIDSTKPADKALTSRTNVLLQTYHINSPDILIELFDNGEIDGDRVSVYHNNAIVVSNQVLGLKPITLNIHADANNREHEFVLVAENLGSIPPNSALMQITAGKQIYKLSVNTDMKTNARIVFIYDGN